MRPIDPNSKRRQKLIEKIGKAPKYLTEIQKECALIDARKINLITPNEFIERTKNKKYDDFDFSKYVYRYDGKLHWKID